MRKVIRKQIRHKSEGIDFAADINAQISVNTSRTEPDDPDRSSDDDEDRGQRSEQSKDR